MPTTVKIDPVTRIEGHLAVEVTVDTVSGIQQVVDAKSNGTMFRGFEAILQGRDPLDAPHFTQRICGVCPISHGMAGSLNLEAAFGVTAPAQRQDNPKPGPRRKFHPVAHPAFLSPGGSGLYRHDRHPRHITMGPAICRA